MLHLFFIFVLISLVQREGNEDPLTKIKENNSGMLNMQLFEEISEEEGLSPMKAAPEGREKKEEQEQGQEERKTREPTEVVPKNLKCESDPSVGQLNCFSLGKSNLLESSLIIRQQSSQIAKVSLESSLPFQFRQVRVHLRPDVCTSVLFVASKPCKCRILELSVACQLNKRTAERTPLVRCQSLELGTVSEPSVERVLLSVNMQVHSLPLHGGSSLALRGLGGEPGACLSCDRNELGVCRLCRRESVKFSVRVSPVNDLCQYLCYRTIPVADSESEVAISGGGSFLCPWAGLGRLPSVNDEETLWVNSFVTQPHRSTELEMTYKRSLIDYSTLWNSQGFSISEWAFKSPETMTMPRRGLFIIEYVARRLENGFWRLKSMSSNILGPYLSEMSAYIKGIREYAAQFFLRCAKIARFFCVDLGIRGHAAGFLASESLGCKILGMNLDDSHSRLFGHGIHTMVIWSKTVETWKSPDWFGLMYSDGNVLEMLVDWFLTWMHYILDIWFDMFYSRVSNGYLRGLDDDRECIGFWFDDEIVCGCESKFADVMDTHCDTLLLSPEGSMALVSYVSNDCSDTVDTAMDVPGVLLLEPTGQIDEEHFDLLLGDDYLLDYLACFTDALDASSMRFLDLQPPKGLPKNSVTPKLKRYAAQFPSPEWRVAIFPASTQGIKRYAAQFPNPEWRVAIFPASTQGIKRNAAQFSTCCSSIELLITGHRPVNSWEGVDDSLLMLPNPEEVETPVAILNESAGESMSKALMLVDQSSQNEAEVNLMMDTWDGKGTPRVSPSGYLATPYGLKGYSCVSPSGLPQYSFELVKVRTTTTSWEPDRMMMATQHLCELLESVLERLMSVMHGCYYLLEMMASVFPWETTKFLLMEGLHFSMMMTALEIDMDVMKLNGYTMVWLINCRNASENFDTICQCQVFVRLPTGQTVIKMINSKTTGADLKRSLMGPCADEGYLTYQGRLLTDDELCMKTLNPDSFLTWRVRVMGGMRTAAQRSVVPPSTPSGNRSFSRLTAQLDRRQDSGSVDVQSTADAEAGARRLGTTVSDRIREACEAAADQVKSADYRKESAREVEGESQIAYHARMLIAAKRNMTQVIQELETLQKEKDSLGERPTPVKSNHTDFNAIKERIRIHEDYDKKIEKAEKKVEDLDVLREMHRKTVTSMVKDQVENLVVGILSNKSDDSPKEHKPPKVNTGITTLPKLTKKVADSKTGVIQWLETFIKETEYYVRHENDRVAYLLSSHYVEPAVWEGVLVLHDRDKPYTTKSLMELLHTAYRDVSTILDKQEEFLKIKQTHPLVAVYTKAKIAAYRKAYGDEASLDAPSFLISWRTNIHPLIARKLKVMANIAVQEETECTFKILETAARKAELKYIEDREYQSYFRSNTHATSSTDNNNRSNAGNRGRGDNRRICRFFNSARGCLKGNDCDFKHVNANAVQGSASNDERDATAPIPSNVNAARGNNNSGRGGNANRGRGRGGNNNGYPARGSGIPNSPCIPCQTDGNGNYDGHYWILCPKATCRFCGTQGHTQHVCPRKYCETCGAQGHTKFAHGHLN